MRPTPTLRGEVLARYAKDWLLDLQDIVDFVREPTVALRASVGSTEADKDVVARFGRIDRCMRPITPPLDAILCVCHSRLVNGYPTQGDALR
jgi:hypothetical protein